MTADELAHETERTRLEADLAEAKAAACDGSEEGRAGLAAAKQAISEFRQAERVGRVPTESPGSGVAAPDPVQVTTSQEGG